MTKEEIDRLTAAKKENPTAGRKRLSGLTGVSINKVQAWLENRAVITASPPAGQGPTGVACESFNVWTARISDHKPQDTIKRKLYELKRGQVYPLSALSNSWGLSEERIRKEGRRFDCLKYVEIKPGDWVACVLHPDTAEEINKQRKG